MELVGRAEAKNAPGYINIIDSDTTEELLDLIAQMAACIREMVEALEPFAEAGRNIDGFNVFAPALFPDEDVAFSATWRVNGEPGCLVWRDFRRAARTLPPAPGAEA